jgi:hypothetical protein
MSSYDDPTQQARRPERPSAPLPGSLDPLRADPSAAAQPPVEADPADPAPTGVLPLDEIFDGPPEPVRESTAAAEAPTWTAMPVMPVRSEPMPMAGRPVPSTYGHPAAEGQDLDTGPGRPARMRGDAASAWTETRRGVEDWIRRDDNGLMLLTALVACVLILVIAAVGPA